MRPLKKYPHSILRIEKHNSNTCSIGNMLFLLYNLFIKTKQGGK